MMVDDTLLPVQEQGSTPQQEAKITTSVVKKLLETHWSKDKASEGAKINPDAVALTAEYLRLFVVGKLTQLYRRRYVLLPRATT